LAPEQVITTGPAATDPAATSQQATQDNPEVVSRFAIPGKASTSKGTAPANPDGKPKESTKSETANPEKKHETTSESGPASEKKDGQPAGDKLIAGKYKTIDEAEKGIAESSKEYRRMVEEKDTEISTLRSQLAKTAALPRDESGRFSKTGDTPSGTGSDFLQQPEVKQAIEVMREVGGDELVGAISTLLGAQAKHLTAGREQDRAEIEEIKLARLSEEFYTEYPDLKTLKDDADVIGDEATKNEGNSKFYLRLLHDAAKGRKTGEIVKQAVAEVETKLRKEFEDRERDLKLASGVTVGSPGSGGAIDDGSGGPKSNFAMPPRRNSR
jgi:hypothetical protein